MCPRERLTLDEMLEQARARIRRLDPRTAHEAAANGALIIDIRSATDRDRDGVVPGSLHIPRTVLEWRVAPDSPWRSPYAPSLDQETLLLCDHGYSSSLAAATLSDLGFGNAGDVVGGFEEWCNAGLPTAKARNHTLAPGERVGMRPPEH
jgi:rhodanese-related sulfurtransferase